MNLNFESGLSGTSGYCNGMVDLETGQVEYRKGYGHSYGVLHVTNLNKFNNFPFSDDDRAIISAYKEVYKALADEVNPCLDNWSMEECTVNHLHLGNIELTNVVEFNLSQFSDDLESVIDSRGLTLDYKQTWELFSDDIRKILFPQNNEDIYSIINEINDKVVELVETSTIEKYTKKVEASGDKGVKDAENKAIFPKTTDLEK